MHFVFFSGWVLFDFQSMKLEDHFTVSERVTDALKVRAKTWGKVSAITQHIVGGLVVM